MFVRYSILFKSHVFQSVRITRKRIIWKALLNLSAILNWGFGHHAPFLSAEQRYYSLLYFFVFQCFVKNTVAITKLSFLFLYLDIFPQRKFRIICWVLIVHISAGLIALSFTTIFQCAPVRFSWDKTVSGSWFANLVDSKQETLLTL